MLSSECERSGADMEDEGEPDLDEPTLCCRWWLNPEVIRTRERKRTRLGRISLFGVLEGGRTGSCGVRSGAEGSFK